MQTTDHHWTQRIQAIAAQAGQDDGAHDLQHLNRVWHTAQILLKATTEADSLVVQAACFLHDLVNLPKNHPHRAQASRLAAQAACRELRAIGFPEEKLGAVSHAIEAHSFSAGVPALTIEAKLVPDADRLDALGSIGLARLFYTGSGMGSALAILTTRWVRIAFSMTRHMLWTTSWSNWTVCRLRCKPTPGGRLACNGLRCSTRFANSSGRNGSEPSILRFYVLLIGSPGRDACARRVPA